MQRTDSRTLCADVSRHHCAQHELKKHFSMWSIEQSNLKVPKWHFGRTGRTESGEEKSCHYAKGARVGC